MREHKMPTTTGHRQHKPCPWRGSLLMYISSICWNCQCRRNFPFMSRYRPSLEEFIPLVGSAPCIPVWRQLTGDGLTPVSAFRLIDRGRFSFLFESVVGGEKVGRFSFLGTEPFLRFEARGAGRDDPDAADDGSRRAVHVGRSLSRARAARRALSHGSLERPAAVRGRSGRLCVVRCGSIHREPSRRPARRSGHSRPFVCALRPDAPVRPHSQDGAGGRPGPRRARASTRRPPTRTGVRPARRAGRSARRAGARPGIERHRHRIAARRSSRARTSRGPSTRRSCVRCQEYIKAGDIFQVVPSQRFAVETTGRSVRHLPRACGS